MPDFQQLDSFGTIRAIASLLNKFPRPWFVAGGWAIDLFLGTVTRPHEDVELVILREDQGLLHSHFAGWKLSIIEDKHGTAEWVLWGEGKWLEQPNYLIRAHHVSSVLTKFEVFLADAPCSWWQFHRNPAITRPLEEIGARSTVEGIPYFVPEIILLWKSQYHRPKDEHDFHLAVPRFNIAQRTWLRDALQVHRPADPWLVKLR